MVYRLVYGVQLGWCMGSRLGYGVLRLVYGV